MVVHPKAFVAAFVFVLQAVAMAAETGPVLPAEVLAALERAKVPAEAVSIVVEDIDGAPRLGLNPDAPRNPASVTKLLTTYAALDLLGPAFGWSTPVWLTGPVKGGVLEGDVAIKGSGDPSLVLERVWLLLRRLRLAGIEEIRGDIVLDRTAFAPTTATPADFDGDAQRPYNVVADALLLNFKSVTLTFRPQPGTGRAVVTADPLLAGVQVDPGVPLAGGPCGDWRQGLKVRSEPSRIAFAGALPASCGEVNWPLAYADPASYNGRLLEAMWRDLGGRLRGRVRDGTAPSGPPAFDSASPPLAAVVREINKFSNNVMAQQLFLTLSLQTRGLGSTDASRDVLRNWAEARIGPLGRDAVIDNGSGLSRDTRVSAAWLARLLHQAYASAVMPELMSSLPINGLDGTVRRSQATQGRAHLKTGSLRDVAAIAGYVLSHSGRRYVLVALVNHPNAGGVRPAFDALIEWTINDGKPPS